MTYCSNNCNIPQNRMKHLRTFPQHPETLYTRGILPLSSCSQSFHLKIRRKTITPLALVHSDTKVCEIYPTFYGRYA